MREIYEKELLYNSLFINVVTVSEYDNIVTLKNCECSKYYNIEQYCKEHNIISGIYCDNNLYKLSEYCKIVGISYVTFSNVDGSPKRELKFISGNESDIIKEISAVLDYYSQYNYTICGLNLTQYELPILFKKLVKYKFKFPTEIKIPNSLKSVMNNTICDTCFIDVFKNWSLNFKEPISIGTLCNELDLKIQDGVCEPYKLNSMYWDLDGKPQEQEKLIKMNSQNYVNLCCQYINKLREI